nr:AMP-binding protein [Cobetia sp. cqz5-12]
MHDPLAARPDESGKSTSDTTADSNTAPSHVADASPDASRAQPAAGDMSGMSCLRSSQEVDFSGYDSLMDMLEKACSAHGERPAFTCMDRTMTFAELDATSRQLADWFQHETDLKPGDRVAIQLPNTLMFPVVAFAVLRAGLVLVNTNPLYTEREMEHQFNDSGARALVVLANMADKVERVRERTGLEYVLVCELGDMHPAFKRLLINTVVKHVKKLVPSYHLPDAIALRTAISQGKAERWERPTLALDDVAVLQYTGGTTGVAKGAMLTHRNLLANMLQGKMALTQGLNPGHETLVAPLPLYHIYAFTIHMACMLSEGNHTLLIPNPRDIPGFVKTLQKHDFTMFVGLNTLFVALCNNPGFQALDFSKLKITTSGGVALTRKAAEEWKRITGSDISEGYGMTETSPIVSFNPLDAIQLGTIGRPMPSTEVRLYDDEGALVAMGEPGELCVKGPQVMKGYWQREQATKDSFTADGFLRTGDIAVFQDDGYMRIVDRKKDMIIVSGFNVYPNEVEDVIVRHPDVLEAAAVSVVDERSGEAIKLYVVLKDGAELEADALRDWSRKELASYKVPRQVVFIDELPKTNVGKVLRRELRDSPPESA